MTWTPRLTQPTRPLSDRQPQPLQQQQQRHSGGHNDPTSADGPVRNVYSENKLSSRDYFERLQKLGRNAGQKMYKFTVFTLGKRKFLWIPCKEYITRRTDSKPHRLTKSPLTKPFPAWCTLSLQYTPTTCLSVQSRRGEVGWVDFLYDDGGCCPHAR